MSQDPEEIVIDVLEILEYEGNTKQFAKKFLTLCHYSACADLIRTLSWPNQQLVRLRIRGSLSPGKLQKVLGRWFSEGEYLAALEVASQKTFKRCFSGVVSDLPRDQRVELKQYLAGMG